MSKTRPGPAFKSHPDCKACNAAAITAERRAIAGGALRLEVMDYRSHLWATDPDWLAEYDRSKRDTRDHLNAPTCIHGRADTAPCKRCGRVPLHEEEE